MSIKFGDYGKITVKYYGRIKKRIKFWEYKKEYIK